MRWLCGDELRGMHDQELILLSKTITRRDFLKMAGGVAALGVWYLIVRPQLTFSSVLPPGALPREQFRAACLRCGKCAAACSQRAIQLSAEGLPHIDGLAGWCDFCMDCVSVCPTGALRWVDPTQARIGYAEINRERCIAWKWQGCRLCYEKCVNLQDAIWLDKDWRPHVGTARCNGCAACVHVCPQSDAEGKNKNFGRAVAIMAAGNGA
jgi:ferredoxin-type protein NapF